MESTLVLVKPDAMQRALAGEVIGRLERKGLRIAGMKLMRIDESLARRHYAEHGVTLLIERDSFADDRWIPAEPALPEPHAKGPSGSARCRPRRCRVRHSQSRQFE